MFMNVMLEIGSDEVLGLSQSCGEHAKIRFMTVSRKITLKSYPHIADIINFFHPRPIINDAGAWHPFPSELHFLSNSHKTEFCMSPDFVLLNITFCFMFCFTHVQG